MSRPTSYPKPQRFRLPRVMPTTRSFGDYFTATTGLEYEGDETRTLHPEEWAKAHGEWNLFKRNKYHESLKLQFS